MICHRQELNAIKMYTFQYRVPEPVWYKSTEIHYPTELNTEYEIQSGWSNVMLNYFSHPPFTSFTPFMCIVYLRIIQALLHMAFTLKL